MLVAGDLARIDPQPGPWLLPSRSPWPGEKAAATHPVTLASCRGLPQTWWHRAEAGGGRAGLGRGTVGGHVAELAQ